MAQHLMMKEFSVLLGGAYEVVKVALFNTTRISEKQVNKLIRNGLAEFNDNILVITKDKYERLCDKEVVE